MIYNNIDFHNVAELIPTGHSYLMQRVSSDVMPYLSETARTRIAFYGTGVELRFVINSGTAELKFYIDEERFEGLFSNRRPTVNVFYGEFQAGYKTADIVLVPGMNTVTLSIPEELDELKRLYEMSGKKGFDPSVVRLIMPQSLVEFVSVSGDISAPDKSLYPDKTILFYGSSITNGADALSVPATFAFRTAKQLGCDYLNLGFSGNAKIEPQMAQFIAARNDYDYICVEFGANVYEYSKDKFYDHVRDFLDIIEKAGKPIFCTDVFACVSDFFGYSDKSDEMRASVKELCSGRPLIHHKPGLEMLPMVHGYLDSDGVHPSVEGSEVLTHNYVAALREIIG